MSLPPLPPESGEPAAPSPRWVSQSAKTSLRILVSVGLLVYLVTKIDLGASLLVLGQARPMLLLVLLGMFVFGRFFAAFRWHALLRRRCPAVTLATTVRITFVSNFVGTFLPGAVGLEAVRIYGLAKSSCNLAEAFTSVFLDRLLGVISLILCVFLGLCLTTRLLPNAIAESAAACLVLLVVMCVMLVSPRVRSLIDRGMPRVLARRIGGRLNRLFESIDAYQRDRGLLAWGLVLALALQAVRVATTMVAARTLRLDDVAVLDFVVFVPIIMFLIMLPISIGGLGVRETAFVQLFGLAGVASEAAVALSILIFLTDLTATLPGAWFYARGAPSAALVPQPGVERSV